MCTCMQVRGGWEQIDGELLRQSPRLAEQVARLHCACARAYAHLHYSNTWTCVCVQVVRLHCGITPGAKIARYQDCFVNSRDLQLEVR